MPLSHFTYDQAAGKPSHVVKEDQIEYGFIGKLQGLKYEYRQDIRDRAALERNFRDKFEALNRVKLSDGEFARLLDEIVTPDVFTAAKTLRSINAFTSAGEDYVTCCMPHTTSVAACSGPTCTCTCCSGCRCFPL